MKILVISNLYPPLYIGGYELICHQVVEDLQSRGHSIEVLTSDYHTQRATEEKHVRRTLRIHGMFGNPWLPIWRLLGLEWHNNRVVRAALRKHRPDLVYCWNFSGLSKSILFTLQQPGVPTAFCVCDHWVARGGRSDVWLNWWNDSAKGTPRLAFRVLRWFCERLAPTSPVRLLRFKRIHFCSGFLREFTKDAGFNVSHGSVIYCPVNTERFTGTAKSAPMRRLLYVGRLHEDKGVMTVLRALACLKGEFTGRLSIYGRGNADYEEKLNDFVKSGNLPVDFYAVDNPDEMPAVYNCHDALVFPSEWGEPFALTPLEAMASGLPVIGTTTGGSAELFRHGENALTYRAGDAGELAQRIRELNQDAELRFRIAAAGQEEVRRRFAQPVIVDQIEAFLKETVAHWGHYG